VGSCRARGITGWICRSLLVGRRRKRHSTIVRASCVDWASAVWALCTYQIGKALFACEHQEGLRALGPDSVLRTVCRASVLHAAEQRSSVFFHCLIGCPPLHSKGLREASEPSSPPSVPKLAPAMSKTSVDALCR